MRPERPGGQRVGTRMQGKAQKGGVQSWKLVVVILDTTRRAGIVEITAYRLYPGNGGFLTPIALRPRDGANVASSPHWAWLEEVHDGHPGESRGPLRPVGTGVRRYDVCMRSGGIAQRRSKVGLCYASMRPQGHLPSSETLHRPSFTEAEPRWHRVVCRTFTRARQTCICPRRRKAGTARGHQLGAA